MGNLSIERRLDRIEKLISCKDKDILNLDEVALYTGLSKSYLYKLTCTGQIPHYKPNGKLVYFNKNEITGWMLSNKVGGQNG